MTEKGPMYFGLQKLFKTMRPLNITQAVIMPTKQQGDNFSDNIQLSKAANKHNGTLFAFPIIDPRHNGPERLRTLAARWKVSGLKLHPHAQGYGVHMPFVLPLVEEAVRLRLPVMVHSGTPPHSTPLQIATLADTFPDAVLILAHMGLSETYAYDARHAARKHDNILLETSGMPEGYVGLAIQEIGPERVIFGSDSPWNIMEAQLAKIRALHLPSEVEEQVLYKNAAKMLKIR
jgi:predicted TIM-barrel fold metal-dependent hydrolase